MEQSRVRESEGKYMLPHGTEKYPSLIIPSNFCTLPLVLLYSVVNLKYIN